MQNRVSTTQGFTLIELLIVIGIISILSGIVLIAVNPLRQFASARNTERKAEVKILLDALDQYSIDRKGRIQDLLPTGYVLGDIIDIVDSGTGGQTSINLNPLVPMYLAPSVPFDPDASTPHDTEYDFSFDADGIVRISAPNAELGVPIILAGRAS